MVTDLRKSQFLHFLCVCMSRPPASPALGTGNTWVGCPVVEGDYTFHLMALLTEMGQGFQELKADTGVSGFRNKLPNCAVNNR